MQQHERDNLEAQRFADGVKLGRLLGTVEEVRTWTLADEVVQLAVKLGYVQAQATGRKNVVTLVRTPVGFAVWLRIKDAIARLDAEPNTWMEDE